MNCFDYLDSSVYTTGRELHSLYKRYHDIIFNYGDRAGMFNNELNKRQGILYAFCFTKYPTAKLHSYILALFTIKEAVQCFGNLALEYSTRCTDMTFTLHFLFFKKFKVRQHILLRKCDFPGP